METPNEETIAVIVNITTGGALYILTATGDDIGGVAMEAKDLDKNVHIFAWEPGWQYYSLGTVSTKYIVKCG